VMKGEGFVTFHHAFVRGYFDESLAVEVADFSYIYSLFLSSFNMSWGSVSPPKRPPQTRENTPLTKVSDESLAVADRFLEREGWVRKPRMREVQANPGQRFLTGSVPVTGASQQAPHPASPV
jgi:hypothetical protein